MYRFSNFSLSSVLPGFGSIVGSAREVRNVRSLTGASMLTALELILHQFTVFFSVFSRLSFAFLTSGMSGMLYGPVVTGFMGAICDILKYLLRNDGGMYFPGFTFNAFVIGFLYGLILYRKPVSLARVFAARLSVMLVVSLFLTPLFLSMLYSKAFIVMFGARVLKNVLMLPVETALLYVILKKVAELRVRRLA